MVSRSTTTMRKLSSQRGGLLDAMGHHSFKCNCKNTWYCNKDYSAAKLKLNGDPG